jgi:hypothetical protein
MSDTSHLTKWDEFLKMAKHQNFDIHLTIPQDNDFLIIAWNEEGILLVADSYNGKLNSARVYYNLQGNCDNLVNVRSAGTIYNSSILEGQHQVNYDFYTTMELLHKNGKFLPNWAHTSFLWLLSSRDAVPEFDYRTINRQRLALLPAHIQAAINYQ